MKNEIVANSCRICLTQTKKLRSLYKPVDEGDEPPNEMLHLITGIQVEGLDEYETLPKNICKNCELALNMAFEFRENALKTQKIIMAHLNEIYKNAESEDDSNDNSYNSPGSNFKTEYEAIMNLEPFDCADTLGEDMQILSNNAHKPVLENEELINPSKSIEYEGDEEKIENEFFKEVDTYALKYNKENDEFENYSDHHQEHNKEQDDEEFEKNTYNDQYEIEIEYKDEEPEMMSAEDEAFLYSQKPTTKTKFTKSNRRKVSKIIQKAPVKLADINSNDSMKLIPRRGRKPNAIKETGHICDICGNVFAKLGRMMEHRQRHDKEFKYSCEICDKKILTRELLRKHMFSHSGGKPLKCRFCSRTFYYKSVRRAHEAVHEGLKPYVCDVCNKAFGYAHALKKHKLIHAEIKLYRCEYCNKDFRLQHHMKQHEMTKLHQNAVRFAQGETVNEDCRKVATQQEISEDILFIEEIADDQLASCS